MLINVASMAAYQPIPNMAVYAAAKAFVLSLTEALWQESLGTEQPTRGVSFQTPRQVVETALRALDRRTPPPSVVSGRLNRLMASAIRLLSRRRGELVADFVTSASD